MYGPILSTEDSDLKNANMSKQKVCVATKRESHQHFLLLLPVGLVAALSFYSIVDKSLWLDEAFSVALARLDWSEMWRVITVREANMGLYHVLLHYWMQLGTGEFEVRSLSAITAIASIAPIYGIGVRLFGVNTGIIAALLLALNAFFIQYAQEARAYALVLLLTATSSYFFLKAIDKPSVRSWGAYAAIGALSMYAHFFSAWVIAANFVSGLALRGHAQKRALVVSNLVIALLRQPSACIYASPACLRFASRLASEAIAADIRSFS
jgi:mannosyltransferase